MNNIVEAMYNDAAVKGIPLGGTFELTPLCNMNCKMCYIRMSREEMEKLGGMRTAKEWLKIAEDAKEAGMLFLLLTGGEPFLYPEFWELYTELKKMGFMISINSNGTLLDDETINRLIADPPYRINITVYGGSDETYKELCRCADGYTRATAAVRKLRAAGVYVKLNGSMTPFNCKDIDECLGFAKAVEVPVELGTYMFPPMRRADRSTGRFDAADAGRYQAEIDIKRLSAEELKGRRERIYKCINEGSGKELPPRFRCRAGRSSFWINWRGEMTPCGMLELFTEYPFENGFQKSWEKIKESIEKQTVLTECVKCEKRDICRVCPAMAYSETGDFNKKPEYVCKMTENWAKELMRQQ